MESNTETIVEEKDKTGASQFNIWLDVELQDKIRDFARSSKISHKDIIEIAVRDFLRKRGAL